MPAGRRATAGRLGRAPWFDSRTRAGPADALGKAKLDRAAVAIPWDGRRDIPPITRTRPNPDDRTGATGGEALRLRPKLSAWSAHRKVPAAAAARSIPDTPGGIHRTM